MALTSCPTPQNLQRMLLGQLTGPEMHEVEQHFLGCAHCVETMQAAQAEDTLAAALRCQAGLDDEPDKEVVAQLIQRITQLRGPSAVRSSEPTDSRLSPAEGPTLGGTLANPLGQRAEGPLGLTQFLAPAQAADEMGRLGGYRVLKVLGYGGMGVVFQAHDPNADRQIALKVMLPAVARKPEARERFLREARATAKIEHDHIVPLYQVSEDNGVPFLAMPLLKGTTLEDWLVPREKSKAPIELAQVLRIGKEIALGLGAAHERGLIHRDIKPANVWLDAGANHRVKILDFGLARPADDASLTQPGMIVGTASYMPPEQARGQNVDPRADLYSLGCVLYRLCTGRLPFLGSDAMSVLVAATTEPAKPVLELNPALPAPLADLVMQLLAKKPEDRPASARDVASRLQALERQFAPDAGDSVDVTLTVLPPRRRRPLAAAGALLAIGGCLAGAVVYVQMHAPPEAKPSMPAANPLAAVSTPPKDETEPGTKPAEDPAEFERWVQDTSKLLAQPAEQWAAVAKKLRERNPNATGMGCSHWIRPKFVNEVAINAANLEDLAALRPLTALKQLRLSTNGHGRNFVTDLSPLKDLKLIELHCGQSRVADLSPLSGMKSLRRLRVDNSPVKDLTPLKDLRLAMLNCEFTEVTDLTPIKNVPLEELHCDADLALGYAPMLTAIPSLKTINDQPKADFLKASDVFERWVQVTAKLSGQKQLDEVIAKLKQRNPSCDGKVIRKEIDEQNVVRLLEVSADGVTDLAPLRALSGLRQLRCAGSEPGSSALSDLKPLSGLKLKDLHVGRTRVVDLSPVARMPLTRLAVYDTLVEDLTPVRGPELAYVACQRSAVRDLRPLRQMPLKSLTCDFLPDRDTALLKSIPTLATINDLPAKDFLTRAESMRAWLRETSKKTGKDQIEAVRKALKETNPQHSHDIFLTCGPEKGPVTEAALWVGNNLKDVTPLRAFKGLKRLTFRSPDKKRGDVKDLGPLVGLGLETLVIDNTRVDALTPLMGMPLKVLHLNKTAVRDLTPLHGLALEELSFQETPVRDLTPLRGMPLRDLKYDLDLKRDGPVLAALKDLRRINDKPAAGLLKSSPGK